MVTRPFIAIEHIQNIAVLRFDRAEKRNAVNNQMIDELGQWFSKPPDGIRAAVLSGRGDHFCAGLDLAEHALRDAVAAMQDSQRWHRVLNLVQFGAGIPVIAAMHGGVIGGGLEIAAAAQVRVADRTAFYQLPEGRRAIFVGGGATVRIARIIGPDRMTEMMLTGRRYGADEGLRLGLSHYLVEPGGAEAKAIELARQIIGNAPLSNYMILNAIAQIYDMPAASGYFAESIAAAMTVTSKEAKAELESFRAKKEARFGSTEANTPPGSGASEV
jgi:enoyl-CoA hydratase/carnithine racemase